MTTPELPPHVVMAEYPRCMQTLRKLGVAYPRTCAECGLGRCKSVAAAAPSKTPELPPLPFPFTLQMSVTPAIHDAWAEQMHAYAESARASLVAEVEKLRRLIAFGSNAMDDKNAQIETLLARVAELEAAQKEQGNG